MFPSPLLRIPPHALVSQVKFHTLCTPKTISLNEPTKVFLWVVCILGQSRMVIHTMVNPKWFEQWNNVNETERNEEYERYKMRFANHLFEWACVHFPKLKEKVKFISSI